MLTVSAESRDVQAQFQKKHSRFVIDDQCSHARPARWPDATLLRDLSAYRSRRIRGIAIREEVCVVSLEDGEV